MSYTYLNHVETEFLAEEQEVGEEADRMIQEFFRDRVGTKSRAFVGEGLRYIITENSGNVQLLEEDGDWVSGELEAYESNDYELICREQGMLKTQEIEASEAEEYLSSGL